MSNDERKRKLERDAVLGDALAQEQLRHAQLRDDTMPSRLMTWKDTGLGPYSWKDTSLTTVRWKWGRQKKTDIDALIAEIAEIAEIADAPRQIGVRLIYKSLKRLPCKCKNPDCNSCSFVLAVPREHKPGCAIHGKGGKHGTTACYTIEEATEKGVGAKGDGTRYHKICKCDYCTARWVGES